MSPKRDQQLLLANESASRAFASLGGFFGRELPSTGHSEVQDLESLSAGGGVGLFGDLDGEVSGRLAVLFEPEPMRMLAGKLGLRGAEEPLRLCSLLLEAANIAFSTAGGVLGDAVGVIVFPSVPRFCTRLSDELLGSPSPIDEDVPVAYVTSAELEADGRTATVRFVWIPSNGVA